MENVKSVIVCLDAQEQIMWSQNNKLYLREHTGPINKKSSNHKNILVFPDEQYLEPANKAWKAPKFRTGLTPEI